MWIMDMPVIWWLYDIKERRKYEQVNGKCGVNDRILKHLTKDITTLKSITLRLLMSHMYIYMTLVG